MPSIPNAFPAYSSRRVALHNYFCEKRNRRVEKEIPILKLFSNEGVQMIFTSFDQDHDKPYSEDAESMNFRRLENFIV